MKHIVHTTREMAFELFIPNLLGENSSVVVWFSPTLSIHLQHREPQLTHITDVIRKNEVNFPEWHASTMKQLFAPPVFENKKKDTGYWF